MKLLKKCVEVFLIGFLVFAGIKVGELAYTGALFKVATIVADIKEGGTGVGL